MRKNYFLVLLAILLTANGIAQNIPSYVPKDGLVGYWPFNGNANDESGNGHHGTNNGATLTTDRNGITNSAYSFDGISSYINLGNSKNLKRYNTNFSISAWIKPKEFSNLYDQSILSNRTSINCGSKFSIGGEWNQIKGNLVYVINGGGTSEFVKSTTKLDTMNYEYVCLTNIYNNNVNIVKLYINGINVNTDTIIGNICDPLNQNTYIGFESYEEAHNSMFFSGIIDDIAIYNRALTEKEITALYIGCTKETATSSNFNTLLLSTGSSVSLSAEPQGGLFTGASIDSNKFVPSKAKIGANKVQYNFKNSQGCNDSTLFTMIVADTVGTTCKKYDTVIVPKTVTKYDTITVTNNVTKYDTVTVTNNVTKYDTITVKNNIYDTLIVPKTITKYDTVKVNTYDTITVTNSVTKYDTVLVNKYDTITVTDTVSILKIKFQLTTGIKANQMTSMSIYPNPTSDVLIIDASDLAAITGYSYRILDVIGKEVYNALVTSAKTEISLKTLGAKGMYVLHILDANKLSVQTKQIILE